MDHAVVCLVSLAASALTLFSGFGLGTLLMPAFAAFFPVPAAVGMTAVVHFLNNGFKLVLFGRAADREVVLRFGLPAVLAAFAGAWALLWLAHLPALAAYTAFGRSFEVLPVKLAVGVLMAGFALFEAHPRTAALAFERRWLPLGGVLSGFFGGLSGHQGALRSAFLIRLGLSKESFVGSGVVIACLVDLTRLGVYAAKFSAADVGANAGLLAAATASAFLGAWGGAKLLEKVTVAAVQRTVAVLLGLFAVLFAGGVV